MFLNLVLIELFVHHKFVFMFFELLNHYAIEEKISDPYAVITNYKCLISIVPNALLEELTTVFILLNIILRKPVTL